MIKHLISLFIVLFALQAWAETSYEDLKARYFKLRNTDLKVTDPLIWVELSDELVGYAYANPKNDNAAHAILQAAILHEQLFRSKGARKDLEEALALLDRVVLEYPKHVLADDALVRRGELLLREESDFSGAGTAFKTVVARYPKGDMLELAQARLQAINSGEINSFRAQTEARALKPNPNPLKLNGRVLVIVLDPGHGGEDFGAVGVGGILEKDIVLWVAFELERLLVEELGLTVRLTRRTDEFIPLAERTNIANDFEADLFISLHGNSSPSGKAHGHEVYILDNSGDQGSAKLAERENASVAFEGPEADLQFMLSDLIQTGKLEDSVSLAEAVQASVVRHLTQSWKGIRDLGIRKGPFYVLVGAHMPCILVEMFFLNNPDDGKLMGQAAFRKQLARGIFLGIRQYLLDRKK